MSETETAVPMDDKALFDAATSDETPDTPAVEVAAETAPAQDAAPARDENGRFAPKAPETVEAKPEPTQQPESAHVPSWRLAEVSEARRAAEARAAENERRAADLERHVYQLSGQLKQYTEKPAEQIDPFADPEKFADNRARQAIDPVKSQVDTIREYYSRKDAIRTHGAETVNEAYDWLLKGQRTNPQLAATVQRALASPDPFEEIVTAFKRDKALSTVGDDPNAWFEKELERRKADPEFMAKLGAAQAQPQAQGAATNIVKLPPSLNRQPGSAGNTQAGSIDDKSLYAFATS
jgi:hypothetical protein